MIISCHQEEHKSLTGKNYYTFPQTSYRSIAYHSKTYIIIYIFLKYIIAKRRNNIP